MLRLFVPLIFLALYASILAQCTAIPKGRHSQQHQKAELAPKHHIGQKTSPMISTSNPTDQFCQSFIKQCYHEALNGKRGHIRVEFACERHGEKYSSSYAFGCKADGVTLTEDILNEIGSGYTVTITEQGSTRIVTDTITDVVNSTSFTNSEIDSTITTDLYQTQITTTTDVEKVTSTETFTSTTEIPVTLTSTCTNTITTMTPITSTVATTTLTFIALGSYPIPVLSVALSPSVSTPSRRRANQVQDSQFCSSYNTACITQCSRVESIPKHVVCQSSDLYHYSLTCYCSNEKVETQHALAAAVNQEHISSVSTITTTTSSYTTVTSTSIVPSTILTTSYATLTSNIPVTSTYISLSAATQTSSTTIFTGTPMTVSTIIPVSSITNTITSTISVTATSSTTQLVIAPTGFVEAYSSDGVSQGYLIETLISDDYRYRAVSKDSATTFYGVVDPSSGLIALHQNSAIGSVIGGLLTYSGQPYEIIRLFASICGGTTAGPPTSTAGGVCESFIFDPQVDAETLIDQTFNLQAVYYEVNPTSQTQITWVLEPFYSNLLIGIRNIDGYDAQFSSTGPFNPVKLRFPVTD